MVTSAAKWRGSPGSILLLAWVASFVSACGDRCPTVQACDIRQRDCQEDTARVAACLGDRRQVTAPIEVVDYEAFVAEEVRQAEAEPPSAEEVDARRALSLLGLLPFVDDTAERVRDSWSRVTAFFSPRSGKITVLDRGEPVDSPYSVLLLLHEIVHAMQQSERGDAYWEGLVWSLDSGLAFDAMQEGEAVLYEDLATLHGFGYDPAEFEWDATFDHYQASRWEAARATDRPFDLAGIQFPYAFGGDYVNRAYREGGNDAVRRIFENPPTSTRAVLAGYGASVDSGDARAELAQTGFPILPPVFEPIETMELGAWMYEIVEDMGSPEPRSFDAFEGSHLAADFLTLFRIPHRSTVVAVWKLRFDSTESASAAFAEMALDEPFVVSSAERDVVLIVSNDSVAVDTAAEQLQWGAVPQADAVEGAAMGLRRGRDERVVCTE